MFCSGLIVGEGLEVTVLCHIVGVHYGEHAEFMKGSVETKSGDYGLHSW